MGFLDYLHGTSNRFNESKHCLRDRLLLSLTPVRQLVPEDVKRKSDDKEEEDSLAD